MTAAATILWYATSFILAAMCFTLSMAIVLAGELRGGLEIWNDTWWRLLSGGRFNAPEEEDHDE